MKIPGDQRVPSGISGVFSDVKALLVGLSITLRRFFDPPVTVSYPEKKPFTSRRWRGVHGLFFTEDNGVELCVSCHLCARICPALCIKMEGHVEPDGTKKLHTFDVDLGRCIYCGYCEEVCPVDAIRLTTSTDYTVRKRDDFVLHKEDLLSVGRSAMKRGEKGALGVRRRDDEKTLQSKSGIGTSEFAKMMAEPERLSPAATGCRSWPGGEKK